MTRNSLFVLGAALIVAGCHPGPRETPTLCVFSATEAESAGADPSDFKCDVSAAADPEAGSTSTATLIQCPAPPIQEGSAYFLRHDLPEGLAPIGKLKIHLQTPCASADREIEAEHIDGRVLLPFTPPRGSECALYVTATMAQSELSCDVVRTGGTGPDPCLNLDCGDTGGAGGTGGTGTP